MLSQQGNELLTRIGPDTPVGELLRSYWHPLCPAVELREERPKRRIPNFILAKICRFGPGHIGLSRHRALSRMLMGQIAAVRGGEESKNVIRDLGKCQADVRMRSCLGASFNKSTLFARSASLREN